MEEVRFRFLSANHPSRRRYRYILVINLFQATHRLQEPFILLLHTMSGWNSNPYANPYSAQSAPVAGPSYPAASSSYDNSSYGGATDPYANQYSCTYLVTSWDQAECPVKRPLTHDSHFVVHSAFDANVAEQSSIYTPGVGGKSGYQPTTAGTGKGRRTVMRKAGGTLWEDPSLMEWDPSKFSSYLPLRQQ